MDSKILKIIAKQIEEEAGELDLDMYEGTHSRLMFIAKVLIGLAEDVKDTAKGLR